TGFHLIKAKDGRILKVADLVDDSDAAKRSFVLNALKDPAANNNRDHVDIIIALGMAKEGFDWIWCEHALTVGYRSSLTEIVQIIGRATRDAEGKERSRFTNLIAEPAAEQAATSEAVNDMLKAISASLLMEQVLSPRYEFTPKNIGPQTGFDYGPEGYQPGTTNAGVNETTGQFHIEINGLKKPETPEATRICKEDLNEVVTSFIQDKTALERGLFDQENTLPEELTQLRMGKIIRDRYPELSPGDHEAIRQHAIAVMNITQQAKMALGEPGTQSSDTALGSTALIDGVRKFINVRELDIDLIDRINPFDAAYAILGKAMDAKSLQQIQAVIGGKKISIPEDEARELAMRAVQFKTERGRLPTVNSADPWEQRMAEGVAAFARFRAQAVATQSQVED
ncbi:MAG: DEAD/DEAH box helicase, partial [Neisseria sp.]